METKDILFEIRFIDTFAFMASSLDDLSSNLKIDKKLLLKAYNLARFDQGVYDLMEMMSEHQQEKEELQEDIFFLKKSVAEYEQFINLNNIKELENYFAN
jgi:hypothetical protein